MKLIEKYKKETIPAMIEKFGFKNRMAVPKIEKITINTGIGKLISTKTGEEQKKLCNSIIDDLSLISGQRPVVSLAKKSISGFKIRQGMPVGIKVTLRGPKMNDFLERFINIALPRSRDFQGISLKSVDGQGNLTIALKEQIIFLEVSPEKTRNIFGLEIVITTTAKTKEQGIELFKNLGFPMKKG